MIIDGEVISDEALGLLASFEALHARPIYPGGQYSGVTIGYGYDLGRQTRERFEQDWAALDQAARVALWPALGLRGEKADAWLKTGRVAQIMIPAEVAARVHYQQVVPRYLRMTREAFADGWSKLSPTAKGVLLSVVYNRGAGMNSSTAIDERLEMREARAAVQAGDEAAIATAIEKMRRVCIDPETRRGLIRRREAEAKLLRAAIASREAGGK